MGLFGGGGVKRSRYDGRFDREMNNERDMSRGYRETAGQSRDQFLEALNGGQAALDQTIRATVARGMPEFFAALNDVQGNAIRRGVSNGLGTFYEGELADAFHENVVNEIGGRAQSMYDTRLRGLSEVSGRDLATAESSRNRYLDIIAGNRDADLARQGANARRRSGLFGGIGAAAGFAIGGPAGAAVGSQIGGYI